MDEFIRYLKINNMDLNDFYEVMNNYLMNEITTDIVNYLKNEENRKKLKKQLMKCNDDTSRQIIVDYFIKKITQMEFTVNQRKYLNEIIFAYLAKSSLRKNHDFELKNNIYMKQKGKCAICNKTFSISAMELDHKLGFKFVGDELHNNTQLLCIACNRRKSTNYNYVLKKYLLKS